MMIQSLSDNLHLIALDLPRPGFHHFLGAWLYQDANAAILIDPGPRSTLPALVQSLEALQVRHIDHILLTHIHLDHAGGLGPLIERYVDAKVICHPRGISHLLRPQKLWEGSLKVLRETAVLYGEPTPVAEKNLDSRPAFQAGDVTVEAFDTPGHAPHHLCFRIGELLFVGEAAGIFYPLERNTYLRIAAPPGFDLQDYRKSLCVLRDLEATQICFGHYGASHDAGRLLDLAAAQAELWVKVIEESAALPDPQFEQSVFSALQAEDPGLAHFRDLPEDVRMRETFFLNNSFRGIRMSLNRKDATP
jgi:glyoxylase-like metal-dependent hydrolase (beta-lactamase superfamily II)